MKRHEMTIKQFAEQEQVTERTVRNWIVKGAIETRRTPGRGIRVVVSDSKRLLILNAPSASA